jgi:nucleotide-binding universal stress UspA family protein
MVEIRNILCPIDFSDGSRRALDHAIAIARWYGSTITVQYVSVGPSLASSLGPPGFERITITQPDPRVLLADVNRFVESEAAPGMPIRTMVSEGPAAARILGQAADMAADLLVMGTHGRSGFERLLLGSVTEKVLRKATCPVLTVPRRHPDAVPASRVVFRNILCAVDFSDCSLHALAYAMSLAQEADARLTLLHVLGYDVGHAYDRLDHPAPDDQLTLAEFRRRSEALAVDRLRGLVPAAVDAGATVRPLVVPGRPAEEILRVANDEQSDLIVVGVQGRGRADLVLFGSTANRIVREAVCPVLTLRGPHA